MSNFLLAVLSLPGVFPGEADCMEALLSAGLGRLHLRKPGATAEELEALVCRLAPRWAKRLVLHGPDSRELALRYAVPNVHGAVGIGRAPKSEGRRRSDGDGRGCSGGGPAVDDGARVGRAVGGGGLTLSTSVHGWDEFSRLPEGLAYAFISPLFDSISKRGYLGNAGLLKQPEGGLPCLPVGLGGVSGETIGLLLEHGWKGAAVLGWIWEERGQEVRRLEQLQKIVYGS